MSRKAYTLSLTLRSPFLFAALEVAAPGLDSSALRDGKGNLVIPGDHIRGHLRHAFIALFGAGDECDALFGKASKDLDDNGGEQNIPARGMLIVGDLTQNPEIESKDKIKRAIYHRVTIDDDTGAAANGMLQMIELPAPLGEEVNFSGRVVIRPGKLKDAETKLAQALRLITAIGAVKSAGFGEVVQEGNAAPSLTEDTDTLKAPAGWSNKTTVARLRLTVAFDRPLLVDTQRVEANSFRSRTIVPGGAIKGALALALEDAGTDVTRNVAFSALRVSHAFSLKGDVLADRALPACIALAKGKEGYCAANALETTAFAALAAHAAPRFPTDWKGEEFEMVQDALARPCAGLNRLPRGRVAIGPNGLAEDSKLFVVNTVETSGREWRFDLDFNGVEDDLKAKILAQFLAGLDGIGRTGARMMVTKVEVAEGPLTFNKDDVIDLLLETPAALTLADQKTSALQQYKAYFFRIGAELETCFAQRNPAGAYLAYRFRAADEKDYLPFELTEAGAVFRLKVTHEKTFNAALSIGLPTLMKAKTPATPDDWKLTPFLPQNGYGEVSVLEKASLSAAIAEISSARRKSSPAQEVGHV